MQGHTPSEDKLRWLACPVCHAGLRPQESKVACLGCGRLFPVVDGIAVLLESSAVAES